MQRAWTAVERGSGDRRRKRRRALGRVSIGAERRIIGPMSSQVVLYDGDCGLCARVVQFVLPRDRHDRFRFAALQSEFARAILIRHGMNTDDYDTFVLVEGPGTPGERLYLRSDAGLRVLAGLGGPWSLAAALRIVPRFIRDAVYDLVARNRIEMFGRADQCMVPVGSARAKFIG